MSRFTIATPTYKRAKVIGRTLDSALDQSIPGVEVIVSDDASPDQTPEVVAGFGDRVRYHRHLSNIGMWPNFAYSAGMVNTEYCSWLQDDDVVCRHFAERALRAFDSDKDVVLYVSWAAHSGSPTAMYDPILFGPHFHVDWLRGELAIIDGLKAAPFCLFRNIGISPALAFRTEALQEAVGHLVKDCTYYNERVVLASILKQGKMAIDPWIGAIQIDHSEQAHWGVNTDVEDARAQWGRFLGFFADYLENLPPGWKDRFDEGLRELPASHLIRVLGDGGPPPNTHEHWQTFPAPIRDLRDRIIAQIPPENRTEYPWMFPGVPDSRWVQNLKRLTHPKVYRRLTQIKRALRNGIEIRLK